MGTRIDNLAFGNAGREIMCLSNNGQMSIWNIEKKSLQLRPYKFERSQMPVDKILYYSCNVHMGAVCYSTTHNEFSLLKFVDLGEHVVQNSINPTMKKISELVTIKPATNGITGKCKDYKVDTSD